MKHLTVLFTFSLLLFTSSAALPIHWDVDLASQPPQIFTLQRPRGETYELEAVLNRHGKPFEPAITNACIYWQTNGMENLYWSAPASVSNNVLWATWLPSMDPGATTVRGYIGDPGHIYAAAFQFRFISSPGALPNELPLPQKVIDFAKVTVLNPPWSGGGGGGGCVDTNAVREIALEEIAPATNEVMIATDAKLSPIVAKLEALQSGKRDKTDLNVYNEQFSPWTWHGDPFVVAALQRNGVQLYYDHTAGVEGLWDGDPADFDDEITGFSFGTSARGGDNEEPEDTLTVSNFDWSYTDADGVQHIVYLTATRTKSAGSEVIDHLATESGVAAAIAAHHDSTKQDKITASGVLKGDGSGGVSAATKSSTASDPANADYRDPQDNTCHKTEYGEWVAVGGEDFDPSATYRVAIENITEYFVLYNLIKDNSVIDTKYVPVGTEIHRIEEFDENYTKVICVQQAVCTDGKKFVTEDVVDGKVSAAVSTNNPAFVSAVRNTPTENMPEDMPTDWGTYGTVGAALAALAAFVKWAKAKIVAVIGDDGKPTDTFATNLFGKQVAKTALMIPLEAKTDSFVAEDGHAYAVTMTGAVTITMPTTTEGKAAIFQARFSAAAQQSVQFDTDDVVKFDGADCGIVKAGKDALLSAMWNGEAWDLVWKNQA